MRRRLAVIALVLTIAAAASTTTALATDLFIYGTVAGRAPGSNDGLVAVRWDFKCLGGKLGEATYEYTLVALRVRPAPATKVTIRKDTAQKGSMTARLPTGTWQLQADPFLCETERGAGSTSPEVGQTVQVPDYCGWVVTKAKGAVGVETSSSVKRARPGGSVAPGSTVVTPGGGAAGLATTGKDATAAVGPGSRLTVDPRQCAARSGWRLSLASGSVAVTTRGADASRDHDVATPNAVATGKAGAWSVSSSGTSTAVRVTRGSVRVKGAKGAPVTVRAGQRTTVAGKAAPSPPARG